MQLDREQQMALDLLQSGANVFLTGSAGTGKSTVTTSFIGGAMKRVNVTATTGIAAINLRDQYFAKSGGKTLQVKTVYSFAGMGLGPKEDQSAENFWKWWSTESTFGKASAMSRIRACDALVIDEISMLPGKILNYLDFHFKRIRKNDKPFGGIQMIVVGDFLQLPPVNKNGGKHYDWAFMCDAWKAADFQPAALKTVHRQDEQQFVRLLNDFRVGRISAESMAVLKSRVSMFCPAHIPRLMPRNIQVDKWNKSQLESLPGETIIIKALLSGENQRQREYLLKNLVTPEILELRIGARVMVTANIASEATGDLVASNGTLAIVKSIRESGNVTILTDDGIALDLARRMWDFDPQDENSAKFYQVPLRLAWASTIHKAQGLTLSEAFISINDALEAGQGYVAISRVRTLAGLHLKDVPAGAAISPAAVHFHDNLPEMEFTAAQAAEAEAPVVVSTLY